MSNVQSVEIYIRRQDVEAILKDHAVTHLLVQGNITIKDETSCSWEVKASGYQAENLVAYPTCPHPC